MGVARCVPAGAAWAAIIIAFCRVQAQSLEQPSATPAHPQATATVRLGNATSPYAMPQTESEGVLREMSDRAAVIFAGTVTAIKKGSDDDLRGNAASSIVEVDFAVEHAVKGATEGSVYALREWAGLWRDSPRFQVGQRLLMLLHAPGAGGLSSPVDGLNGAIPLKSNNVPPTAALQAMALAAHADIPHDDTVDLRWLEAKTLRLQTFADEPAASPGEGLPSLPSTYAPSARFVVSAAGAPTEPSKAAGLTHILGLLTSWRETGDVPR